MLDKNQTHFLERRRSTSFREKAVQHRCPVSTAVNFVTQGAQALEQQEGQAQRGHGGEKERFPSS
ncbi:hypothetical protein D187_005074 [Cystobacter fuscus DSM 2262]|uniref:Uncharacterized protein n=1 Tax=Cystobacter fuscus (strain ATCC 25194 / DSM 2262 / NBRC 100088 / M29) TaxID=1242864 RepID=S9PLP1_CYSF2|nr:hypothetical protein D187_005074 [Cystobacter fuscus DSM 2262]